MFQANRAPAKLEEGRRKENRQLEATACDFSVILDAAYAIDVTEDKENDVDDTSAHELRRSEASDDNSHGDGAGQMAGGLRAPLSPGRFSGRTLSGGGDNNVDCDITEGVAEGSPELPSPGAYGGPAPLDDEAPVGDDRRTLLEDQAPAGYDGGANLEGGVTVVAGGVDDGAVHAELSFSCDSSDNNGDGHVTGEMDVDIAEKMAQDSPEAPSPSGHDRREVLDEEEAVSLGVVGIHADLSVGGGGISDSGAGETSQDLAELSLPGGHDGRARLSGEAAAIAEAAGDDDADSDVRRADMPLGGEGRFDNDVADLAVDSSNRSPALLSPDGDAVLTLSADEATVIVGAVDDANSDTRHADVLLAGEGSSDKRNGYIATLASETLPEPASPSGYGGRALSHEEVAVVAEAAGVLAGISLAGGGSSDNTHAHVHISSAGGSIRDNAGGDMARKYPSAPPSPEGYSERALSDDKATVVVASAGAGEAASSTRHAGLSLGGESSSGIAGETPGGLPEPRSRGECDGRALSDEEAAGVAAAANGGRALSVDEVAVAGGAAGDEHAPSGTRHADVSLGAGRNEASGGLPEPASPDGECDGQALSESGVAVVVDAAGEAAYYAGARHARLSSGGGGIASGSIADGVGEGTIGSPSLGDYGGRRPSDDETAAVVGGATGGAAALDLSFVTISSGGESSSGDDGIAEQAAGGFPALLSRDACRVLALSADEAEAADDASYDAGHAELSLGAESSRGNADGDIPDLAGEASELLIEPPLPVVYGGRSRLDDGAALVRESTDGATYDARHADRYPGGRSSSDDGLGDDEEEFSRHLPALVSFRGDDALTFLDDTETDEDYASDAGRPELFADGGRSSSIDGGGVGSSVERKGRKVVGGSGERDEGAVASKAVAFMVADVVVDNEAVDGASNDIIDNNNPVGVTGSSGMIDSNALVDDTDRSGIADNSKPTDITSSGMIGNNKPINISDGSDTIYYNKPVDGVSTGITDNKPVSDISGSGMIGITPVTSGISTGTLDTKPVDNSSSSSSSGIIDNHHTPPPSPTPLVVVAGGDQRGAAEKEKVAAPEAAAVAVVGVATRTPGSLDEKIEAVGRERGDSGRGGGGEGGGRRKGGEAASATGENLAFAQRGASVAISWQPAPANEAGDELRPRVASCSDSAALSSSTGNPELKPYELADRNRDESLPLPVAISELEPRRRKDEAGRAPVKVTVHADGRSLAPSDVGGVSPTLYIGETLAVDRDRGTVISGDVRLAGAGEGRGVAVERDLDGDTHVRGVEEEVIEEDEGEKGVVVVKEREEGVVEEVEKQGVTAGEKGETKSSGEQTEAGSRLVTGRVNIEEEGVAVPPPDHIAVDANSPLAANNEIIESSEVPTVGGEQPHADVAVKTLGLSTSYVSTDDEGVDCPLDWEALAREVEAEWVLDVSENGSDIAISSHGADVSALLETTSATDEVQRDDENCAVKPDEQSDREIATAAPEGCDADGGAGREASTRRVALSAAGVDTLGPALGPAPRPAPGPALEPAPASVLATSTLRDGGGSVLGSSVETTNKAGPVAELSPARKEVLRGVSGASQGELYPVSGLPPESKEEQAPSPSEGMVGDGVTTYAGSLEGGAVMRAESAGRGSASVVPGSAETPVAVGARVVAPDVAEFPVGVDREGGRQGGPANVFATQRQRSQSFQDGNRGVGKYKGGHARTASSPVEMEARAVGMNEGDAPASSGSKGKKSRNKRGRLTTSSGGEGEDDGRRKGVGIPCKCVLM